MTYQLYRLTRPGDDLENATLLGTYDQFDEALAARDADTAWLFGSTEPGELLQAHHQVLGPGLLGPATAHPVSTELERPTPASLHDIRETHDWLNQIHRSA